MRKGSLYRQVFAGILIYSLILTSGCVSVLAAEISNETQTDEAQSCGENLTWSIDGTTLYINGTGEMDNYSQGTAPWYAYISEISDIQVADGVASIGAGAFWDFTNLKSITITESVTSIGENAFQNCGQFTIYGYTYSVAYYYALENDLDIQTIGTASNTVVSGKCGDDVTYSLNLITGKLDIKGNGKMDDYGYNTYAPWNEYGMVIRTIEVSDGVTSVGDRAFYEEPNLEHVQLGNDVKEIGGYAFNECRKLNDINLPSSITKIDSGAFFYCSSLKSIDLPNGINKISDRSFTGCSSLEEITIPEGVTVIEEFAFGSCSGVKEIHFPETIVEIQDNAFWNVGKLSSIKLGAGINKIADSAFDGQTSDFIVYGYDNSRAY